MATLLRQSHLSQERLVTRVGFEIPQERVAFNAVEHYILLAIRSVKPIESLVNFATISVNFSYPIGPAPCMRLRGPRECRVYRHELHGYGMTATNEVFMDLASTWFIERLTTSV